MTDNRKVDRNASIRRDIALLGHIARNQKEISLTIQMEEEALYTA